MLSYCKTDNPCWVEFVRPHCLHAMHRYSLLLWMSHVVWSVCLCVCWVHLSAVQKWLNWFICNLHNAHRLEWSWETMYSIRCAMGPTLLWGMSMEFSHMLPTGIPTGWPIMSKFFHKLAVRQPVAISTWTFVWIITAVKCWLVQHFRCY